MHFARGLPSPPCFSFFSFPGERTTREIGCPPQSEVSGLQICDLIYIRWLRVLWDGVVGAGLEVGYIMLLVGAVGLILHRGRTLWRTPHFLVFTDTIAHVFFIPDLELTSEEVYAFYRYGFPIGNVVRGGAPFLRQFPRKCLMQNCSLSILIAVNNGLCFFLCLVQLGKHGLYAVNYTVLLFYGRNDYWSFLKWLQRNMNHS